MKTIRDIAEAFARKRHKGQFRRDQKTPYIRHVGQVARRARRIAARMPDLTSYEIEMAEVVGWLHDLIEMGVATAEELIAIGIPRDAVDAVLALTRTESGATYEDDIMRAKKNRIARPVKIADNLANLSDDPTDNQIIRYAKSLQTLYEPLYTTRGTEPGRFTSSTTNESNVGKSG